MSKKPHSPPPRRHQPAQHQEEPHEGRIQEALDNGEAERVHYEEDEAEQIGREVYGGGLILEGPEQQAVTQVQSVSQALVVPGSGGTGYALNDNVTLTSGVVVKAATMTGSKIASVSVVSGGSANFDALPPNPVAQVSTTGSGAGAKFNLTWTYGAPPIGATAPPTFPPTSGTAPVPVPPGTLASATISAGAVPPSVAGITQPVYRTGNATTPANLFPGNFSTNPPYPPVASGGFNNVTVVSGIPPWRITAPPVTSGIAPLMKDAADIDGGYIEAGDAGTVHSGHAEPAERRGRPVLQRPNSRQEY